MTTHAEVKQHVNLNYASAVNAGKKNDLPGVWKVARPILNLLAGLILIPSKWRTVISILLSTVDAVTAAPVEEPSTIL